MSQVVLPECPSASQGVHRWLFRAACLAIDAGLTNDEATALIEPAMTRPQQPPDEIASALAAARQEERPKGPRWPGKNFKIIQSIIKSPMPEFTAPDMSAEEAIDLLFPGNPLLCVGKTSSIFHTRPREIWRGKEQNNSLIVPSPMSAVQGRTKQGHMSEHCLANTGERHYLVCEQDFGTPETQIKTMFHLAQYGELVMLVHSGSKSTHAWYDCRGESEEAARKFFNYACRCGVDPVGWQRQQFMRMPMGHRETGELQQILYFNHAAFDKPKNLR